MKRSAKMIDETEKVREISERSLLELREQLFWVILRCREKARSMCEEAGFTTDEVGLQFIHPTIGPRKSYTMICLRME